MTSLLLSSRLVLENKLSCCQLMKYWQYSSDFLVFYFSVGGSHILAIFLNGRRRKIPNREEKKCQPTIIVTVAEHTCACLKRIVHTGKSETHSSMTYCVRQLWKRRQIAICQTWKSHLSDFHRSSIWNDLQERFRGLMHITEEGK